MMKGLSLVALTASLVLTACGGGGSGDVVDSSNPGTGTDDTSLANYSGTFVGPCVQEESEVLDARTGQSVNVVSTIVVNAISASQATGSVSYAFYGSDDATCSLSPLSRQTYTSATHVFSGPVSIDLNGSAVSAYRVKTAAAALGGISAGQTVTVNGVVYPGNYFQTPLEILDVFYLDGNKLYTGDLDTVTEPSAYPTALDGSLFGTKQ